MKYYIYIDESGSFDEALEPSGAGGRARPRAPLVGGVCSNLSSLGWDAIHKQTVEAFNKESRIQFAYPKHFHSAPLLKGRIRVEGPVTPKDTINFVEAVDLAVVKNATFTFASRNPVQHFEYSPQATYVLNLVTAVRAAMAQLAQVADDVTGCEIKIAQRTIRETEQRDESRYPRRGDYMSALIRFVRAQALSGEGEGIVLARRLSDAGKLHISSGVGDKDPGLMAADFMCSAIRWPRQLLNEPVVVVPPVSLGGDLHKFYEDEVRRLIKEKQYAAAAEFLRRYLPQVGGTPDIGPVLYALKREKDHDILHRELNALLAEAECLTEKRTAEAGSLGAATHLLEELHKIASALLDQENNAEVVRKWADLEVQALVLLGSCYSHKGVVGPQAEVEEQLADILRAHKPKISLSYFQRRELVLEAKVRNLNLLFNDYRFADVMPAIETDLAAREEEIPPDETDELLGKMQGSMGQACAFLSRQDPDWSEMARDYFTKSLAHFQPGTLYHAMSVNYLAALAWQEDNLQLAVEEMNRHGNAPQCDSPADLVSRLSEVVANAAVSPFNAVNYLRIAASQAIAGDTPTPEALASIGDYWKPQLTPDHPYEQLAKWLGFLHQITGSHLEADTLYTNAVAICEKLDFTLHTIGLSIVGLQASNCAASGAENTYAKHLNHLREWGTALQAQSTPFADYLAGFGGIEGLVESVKERDQKAALSIARSLPFNYA